MSFTCAGFFIIMLYYGLYICSYTTSIRTKLKLNFQNLAAFSHIFVAVITAFNVPLVVVIISYYCCLRLSWFSFKPEEPKRPS